MKNLNLTFIVLDVFDAMWHTILYFGMNVMLQFSCMFWKLKTCHYGNFGKQVGFLKYFLNRSFHNWTDSATDMTKMIMHVITVDYRLYVEIITFTSYLNTSFLYLNNFFRTRLYHITYTFYFQKYDFLVLSN